jgi:lipoate-protein ligase B
VDITRRIDRQQWLAVEFDTLDYGEALSLQHALVAARRNGAIDQNVLLLLEHPPVFTLGRRGGSENLKVSAEFLKKHNIAVVQIERGGNITYHGPGQLVAYTICDLNAGRKGVEDFVRRLEEVMLRVSKSTGVAATRDRRNRGIWVGDDKLGSVGIAIRRGITFHGLALNVDPCLEHFGWINPCGLQNAGVTSIRREISQPVSMQDIREAFKHHFSDVFGAVLQPLTQHQLTARLEGALP